MAVDLILVNGKVLTMEPSRPFASAFAVSRSCFAAVGTEREVRAMADRHTEVVDLHGLTVVPGLIETHSHLSLYAMTLLQANCRTPPNRSLEDVKKELRRLSAQVGPGNWVKGWGFDDTLIAEKRHLTLADLDEALPENPAFISHASGHIAYVNSMALRIAEIGAHTPQPLGGEIQKDVSGNPTGLLIEDAAQSLVTRHIPNYRVDQLKQVMAESISHFHRYGFTSVHDAAIGYFRHEEPIIKAYRELEEEGRLQLGIYLTIVERAYRSLRAVGLGTGFGSDRLKIGCVKLFQDGSIQALTAALWTSYRNAPGHCGELLYQQEDLNELICRYHQDGHQIAVHANGDRAIDSVLQAMDLAQQRFPRPNARHMLIHCQLATAEQIRKMKSLGVIPSYFVNHVHYWGDRHVELFLGEERAARIDPLASTVSEALRFTLHSDLPVTPVNPFFSMYCAVNRLTRSGKLLGSEERINPLEALKAYTSHAAYCSFEEKSKGSIAVGKKADCAVLSANPLDIHTRDIKDIEVVGTMAGGEWVYHHL